MQTVSPDSAKTSFSHDRNQFLCCSLWLKNVFWSCSELALRVLRVGVIVCDVSYCENQLAFECASWPINVTVVHWASDFNISCCKANNGKQYFFSLAKRASDRVCASVPMSVWNIDKKNCISQGLSATIEQDDRKQQSFWTAFGETKQSGLSFLFPFHFFHSRDCIYLSW